MVIIDVFTGLIVLRALRDKTPKEMVREFHDAYVCVYGTPDEVHTDGGTEWKCKFAKYLQNNSINHTTTPVAMAKL